MAKNVIEVTDNDFEEQVINAGMPVIVDFWETSCGSCVALEPMYESLAKEFDGQVKFVKLNVEDNTETAEEYEIKGYPTFMVFKDGEQVDEFEGDELPTESDLRDMISNHIDEEDSDEEESEDIESISLDKSTYRKLKAFADDNETSINEEIGKAFVYSYDDIEDEDLEAIDIVKEDGEIYVVLPENIYVLIEDEANNNSTELSEELELVLNEYLLEEDDEDDA